MKGCTEILSVQPECVGDESGGGKEEEGFKVGGREVRKRRVFSWVILGGQSHHQCAGASGEAESS